MKANVRVLFLTLLLVAFMAVATVGAQDWADGVYFGSSDAGPRGYALAMVTIASGQIADVNFVEFTGQMVPKRVDNYRYELAITAGEILAERVLATGSGDVDGITGATSTVNLMLVALERALEKASGLAATNQFFDGTFMGRSSTSSRGYYEVIWVTLEDDVITDMVIERVTAAGTFQDLDAYPFDLASYREQYTESVLAQGWYDVDAISGATTATEEMWPEAVADALRHASRQSLRDGSFLGYSDANPRGYAKAEITVEAGQIVSIDLTEFTQFDVAKDENYRYRLAIDAQEILSDNMLERQSFLVDAVSGATTSSRMHVQALQRAIIQAMQIPVTDTLEYFSGTFMGRTRTAPQGFYEVVWVEIAQDQITGLTIERVTSDGQFQDFSDYRYPIGDYMEQFTEAVVAAGNLDIDAISGATTSTEDMWPEAINDALQKAQIERGISF